MKFKVLLKTSLSFSLLVALLLGCGGKSVKPEEGDPGTLYREGLVRFNKRDYPEALKRFQELKSNFPDSPPYTLWAELKVGDCHFFSEEYVEAIAAYEEFKKVHPTHEELPYVQYQIGMSYFKQMLSLDRDPASTKKALSAFEYLIANFPPSLFTEKAKEKVGACKKRLAEHEFYVGRYYYRHKNYWAASIRFQELLVNFPKMPKEDETLFFLGKSYLEREQDEKAREVLSRILNEYPQSSRSREARRLLEEIPKAKKPKKKTTELEPEILPFTKYEEERKQSVPYHSPLNLPVRKINPHPRVEMELEFIPEEEKRIVISPKAPRPTGEKEKEGGSPKPEAGEKEKEGASPKPGEVKLMDQRQPIDITSDEVETYTKENRVIFKGNVVARQKDMVIYADSIEAILGKEGKGIERVIASGNVKVQQGLRVASCEKAVFDNPEQKIILMGDPKVWEGENMVSGEEILFDISKNRLEVKGGESRRSKVMVHPDKGFEKLK
jgi:outer membrane protein assembly factor BamD